MAQHYRLRLHEGLGVGETEPEREDRGAGRP